MTTTTYAWQVVATPNTLVNDSMTAGWQADTAVAGSVDGMHFYGVWTDPNGTESVQGRLIGRNGTPAQGQVIVNTTTLNNQNDASVAALNNGRFVTTFTDTSVDPDGDIRARFIGSNGQPLSVDFAIANSSADDRQSDVARLYDGGFAVTWTRDYGGGDNDILAQVLDADGSVRNGLVTVNSASLRDTSSSSLAGLSGGGFVVAWEERPAAGGDTEVRLRRFDDNGTALDGTIQVGVLIDTVGSINRDIQVAALPDGGFVVAYTDNGWISGSGTDITARAFNADGSPRSASLLVNDGEVAGNQYQPTLTALSNGYFAVGWNDNGTIMTVQVYDADGNPIVTNGQLGFSDVREGEIAGLAGGRLVSLQESNTPDAGGDPSIQTGLRDLVRSISGNNTSETIVGLGDGLRETLVGWGGDDTLVSGASANLMNGGDGLDYASYITASSGVVASLTNAAGNAGEAAGDTYFFVEGLVGSAFDDTLTGDGGQNTLKGGDGNDTLSGGAGVDHLIGGVGADTMAGGASDDFYFVDNAADAVIENAGEGTDTVNASVNFVLTPNVEYLHLLAGAGPINGTGNALNNTIFGNESENVIDGRAGQDSMEGGAGNDTYFVDDPYEPLTEFAGEGVDTVITSVSRDIVGGHGSGVENLILAAGAGAINGTGNTLDNVITGNASNNVLTGGGGGDVLIGGAGDDTAVFSQSLDKYTVTDLGNKIVVSGPDGMDTLSSIEHLQFTDGMLTPEDGNALIDTVFYMSHNLDVFHAGMSAPDHFASFGWHEGRDPNAFFSMSGYLAVNKDVAAAGVNPLDHYHLIGWQQGRDPGANFDTTLYLISNPEIAAAGMDPLLHYLQSGMAEGRAAYAAVGSVSDGFDAQYYLFHNPDVAAAGVDPLFHYSAVGWHEGRNPNAYFDTAGYLAHYTDVAAAGINPLQHYETIGWTEGRDPSSYFDTQKYLTANPDVAAAHVNPLDHFLQCGIYEGRAAINDGQWF